MKVAMKANLPQYILKLSFPHTFNLSWGQIMKSNDYGVLRAISINTFSSQT
jgi:hypothetical protein